MRTFEKSSKLDNVLYDVRGPVVDEAGRIGGGRKRNPEAEYRKSVSFWIFRSSGSDSGYAEQYTDLAGIF